MKKGLEIEVLDTNPSKILSSDMYWIVVTSFRQNTGTIFTFKTQYDLNQSLGLWVEFIYSIDKLTFLCS